MTCRGAEKPDLTGRRSDRIVWRTSQGSLSIYTHLEFSEDWRFNKLSGRTPSELHRQVGILRRPYSKGEKPADLPVQEPTKFELNHQSQDRRHPVSRSRPRSLPALMR